ncbi:MAG: 3-dehydroquinate synthase [Pseudomonadota bacterium]|jgi:shikimate kinase/3-dehydroquinate synthase
MHAYSTRPLILNGFMATGKSTVGRLVAARRGVPFVDLDLELEQRAGLSIPEWFATHGEAHFRALETQVLTELLSEGGARVIAVGGGALLRRETRLLALDRAVVITLSADLQTLLGRAAADPTQRPLFRGGPDAIARLLETRLVAYAEAHAQLDVSQDSPAAVAEAADAIWTRDPIGVAAGLESYSVEIGNELLATRLSAELVGASAALMITDTNVDPLYGAVVRRAMQVAGHTPTTFRLTPGEEHKNPGTLAQIWEGCLAAGLDRKSRLVGLGGGVTTDVTGFAAATWMRGISWYSCPTTLLGMVDASVGGKTAVDLPGAKNCVGAFWQPTAVFCDISMLRSEPDRGFRSALAEVVKTALIGDAPLFELLEREAGRVGERDSEMSLELVRRCIAVKARVVSEDARESGIRASLNLGHTIGHALEAHGGYGALTHGEAVSLGLVAAMRVGVRLGHTPLELEARVTRLLSALGLPTDLSTQPLASAAGLLANDKKRGGAHVQFVLATEPGQIRFQKLALDQLQQITSTLA